MSQLSLLVGMVFQKPNPFPMSIYENVAYGVKIGEEKHSQAELDNIVELALFTTDESRIGQMVEFSSTKQIFMTPVDQRINDYVSGRFG